MADRTVYGRTHSENGWRMVDTGSCRWVKVPGTNVSLQIREGQPAAIMGAFAADYHANVEPLRDADSACWTATNSVATSNHLSGTGMDLNWNGPDGRTFRLGITKERAYPGDKARKLDELLAFYEGMIFCGGEWSIRDWMHFQMGGNTYGSQHVEKVNDFIRRKIRADGFSTFKRGATSAPPAPAPPPPVVAPPPAATILARAAGITQALAEQILPQVSFALVKANCTNPRRIAAALAQWIIESGRFVYTEEIADGPESQERWKYKGRTWVQLTWLENYHGFSQWCHSLGLVPTPDYFVVRPRELAEQKWAALGPAYWWAIKYPRINEYADRGDIDNVSKWVNAPAWVDNPNKHANHEAERRAAYNKALALGDQLLTLVTTSPTPPGDDMAQVPQEQWDRVYRELTQLHPSRSPLRHLDDTYRDTATGFGLNADGHGHLERVELLASLGHTGSLDLLREVASATDRPDKYPDRQDDAKVAQAILARVYSRPALATEKVGPAAPAAAVYAPSAGEVASAVVAALPAQDNSVALAEARAEAARLRAENEQLRAQVAQADGQRAAEAFSTAVATAGAPTTSGDIVGQVVDSVEEWMDRALQMDTKQRAALSATLRVLELPKGSEHSA
ncbi:hypothetical protein [Mycobacterium sp. NPDC050041]|uniref:hypothetical protein n=1 Tax=Mycobacterium sp. NPDC050041 TaxID=3364293 RepID=UPI003C2DCDA4